MNQASLLLEIGNRTRGLRTKNGWTLKEIAERSGLSLRFLSDLEAGKGNISVARLADVARALEVPIVRLLPLNTGDHSPFDQVMSLLDRCNDEDLDGLLKWLGQRLGDEKRPVIALVGLRGAGKSTIGCALARSLGIRFVELDAWIEKEANLSLGELFSLHGEEYYRRLAHDLLVKLLGRNEQVVVATGGSVVTNPDTWSLLKRRCHTVWLKAKPEDHWRRVLGQGDTRPMANRASAMSELRSILAVRSPLYAQAAQTVDTSAVSTRQAARLIADAVRVPETRRTNRRLRPRGRRQRERVVAEAGGGG